MFFLPSLSPPTTTMETSSQPTVQKMKVPSSLSLALSVLTVLCLLCRPVCSWSASDTRRSFLAKIPAAVVVVGPAAHAYDAEVGGRFRSAETSALNSQAKETNSRLERDGFKLDSREEEAAKISSALGSFSYEPTKTGRKGGSNTNGNSKSGSSSGKR